MKRTMLVTCLLLARVHPVPGTGCEGDSWEKDCQKCHGPDGKGGTKMGKKVEVKDYTDPAVRARPDQIIRN